MWRRSGVDQNSARLPPSVGGQSELARILQSITNAICRQKAICRRSLTICGCWIGWLSICGTTRTGIPDLLQLSRQLSAGTTPNSLVYQNQSSSACPPVNLKAIAVADVSENSQSGRMKCVRTELRARLSRLLPYNRTPCDLVQLSRKRNSSCKKSGI
jgi:hypothetical protein